MSRSRRKNWNAVNAPSLARWIVLTGFLALTGLAYVYLTIQLHHLGNQKKTLEKALADSRMQNEVAGVQIATLTSHSALQRRWKEGSLKMIPILDRNLVHLTAPAHGPKEDAVQPVVNQRAGP